MGLFSKDKPIFKSKYKSVGKKTLLLIQLWDAECEEMTNVYTDSTIQNVHNALNTQACVPNILLTEYVEKYDNNVQGYFKENISTLYSLKDFYRAYSKEVEVVEEV